MIQAWSAMVPNVCVTHHPLSGVGAFVASAARHPEKTTEKTFKAFDVSADS
jgi:hypothetical protein